MASRMIPKDRKAALLNAAVAVAEREGFWQFSREQVGKEAECSPSLISAYFKTMDKLRNDVMREAVKRGIAKLVMQGLAGGHKVALKAPEELKDAARKAL